MITTNTTLEPSNTPNHLQSIIQDPLALINEEAAASFLNVTPRALQGWRLNGSGPKYVRISCRCIRYRKADLVSWSEDRLKASTSEN